MLQSIEFRVLWSYEIVGSYTIIEKDLAQKIIDHYGLGHVSEILPLSLGISNSNYKINIEGTHYLLKVSNDKNREQLQKEVDILLHLNSKNFPYSLIPHSLVTKEYTYKVNGYCGVIFPFSRGIPPGPSDHTCFDIGQGLASLHLINWQKSEITAIRNYQEVGDDLDQIDAFAQNNHCPKDFKDIYQKLLVNKLDKWSHFQHRHGLIHGDLYYDNTLFDQNRLKTILDFEQAGYGKTLLDLGISISGTCLEKGRIITPLIQSYLKGYESVLPLTSNEKKLLNLAIIIGLFSISLWRIKRFTLGTLDPSLKNSYKDLLYKAENFHHSIGIQNE